MKHNLRLAIVPAYLLLCLLLGGASNAGVWANMLLQLLALGIIFWSLTVRRNTPTPRPGRQLLGLVAVTALLILMQLIPLPPSLWSGLPGRDGVAEGFALLGQPLPWLPLSLAPSRTIASALWLLPAVAVLLGIVKLGGFKPGWIGWAIVIIACLSVLLGALQIVGGNRSAWYLYRVTNYGQTTGFFANSNHMATLLVVTIPFLAALYLRARSRGRSAQRESGMLVILAGALAVIIVGIIINGSLAGIGLIVPVAAATVLMLWSRNKPLPRGVGLLLVPLVALAVYIASSVPFGNNLVGAGAKGEDSRQFSFSRSIEAAGDYAPLGSGIGTFQQIFPSYEDPTAVTRTYINHVHGDYIELALETGAPGLLILLLFLAWWLSRAIFLWRTDQPDYVARAATIASAAILAHSLVDYPLRTAAISAIFAACCALMAEPRPRAQVGPAQSERQARHLSAD